MEIPFVGGSYKGRSSAVDGQSSINYYLEMFASTKFQWMTPTTIYSGAAEATKTQKVLYPTPGLTLFASGKNSGPVRCLYTTSTGRMFAVIGDMLSEFLSGGTEITRGILKTSVGIVSMADCGNGGGRGFGLCIVDGQYGYNYNLTNNTFEQIVDPTFQQSTRVVFVSGYFIINEINSNRCHYSHLYNCLDWGDLNETWNVSAYVLMQKGNQTFVLLTGNGSPAINLTSIDSGTYVTLTSSTGYLQGIVSNYNSSNAQLTINITSYNGNSTSNSWAANIYTGSARFFSKEGNGDLLRSLASIRGELWLIGDQTIEVWYNPQGALDDATNIPFAKVRGAFINIGTAAVNSAVNNGNNLFWLGSSVAGSGRVWISNSYQPTVVSTSSIDHIIETMPNIQDATAFTYTQEGHEFYVINFNQGEKTLVYDTSTGEWHERAYWNSFTSQFERHLPDCHCLFNNINYVGDYRSGNIYFLDLNNYTDNGDVVRRIRIGPHIHSDRKRMFFKEFEIDIERGTGIDGSGQGSDPIAFLQWSDDGGFTWSNEYWARIGAKGQYKTRLHWHRLGYSRDRVFKLTVSDPVKMVLIGARGEISIENANA